MTRMSIHGGQVDILCACGNPEYLPSSLKYGFRLNFFCIECDVEFALDVIEWVVSVLLSKFVMNAFFWKELGVKKNESQTIYR